MKLNNLLQPPFNAFGRSLVVDDRQDRDYLTFYYIKNPVRKNRKVFSFKVFMVTVCGILIRALSD